MPLPQPSVSVSAGWRWCFEKTVVCAVNAYGGLQSKADGEWVTKGVVGQSVPLVVVKMCLRGTTVYRRLMGGTQTSERKVE